MLGCNTPWGIVPGLHWGRWGWGSRVTTWVVVRGARGAWVIWWGWRSWECLGASCGGFFPSGGRLGGDVAYDWIFGMVSESFGDGFSLIFYVKMGSS